MALTLVVDDKKTENPDSTDIASAFELLDKRPAGLLKGAGLSMIILARSEADFLMATGCYAGGFVLSYQDGNPEYEYNSDLHQPVPVDETIKMFQAYARGENWGQSNIQWNRLRMKYGTVDVVKRLLIIGFIGFLAFVLIKYVIGR